MRVTRVAELVGIAAMAVVTVWLYSPALHLELVGDDYQWVQHAARAVHRPILFFADLDSFYRPASTWTLAVDWLLWLWSPSGYHATNLALHLGAALVLTAAARRLGLGARSSLAVGCLWALSPWASESAIQVAIRFESILLASWCALIALWPRDKERWDFWRLLGVCGVSLLAAASKETWVITPVLAVLLERFQRRRLGSAAWVVPALLGVCTVLYCVAYFGAFPSDKGYFSWGPGTLTKIPQLLAGFFWLAPHRPLMFEWSPALALAVAGTAALGAMAWRTGSPPMAVGLGLLLLPAVPTLGIPYLPLRHCSAPYAGFLLLVVGALAELGRRLRTPHRMIVGGLGVTLATLSGVSGALVVRAELEDAKRLSAAHRAVLDHAREVADLLLPGEPVLIVRADQTDVLAALARSPRGWPKLLYPRHDDPGALIDAAALFWWVRARPDEDVVRRDDLTAADLHRSGEVLIYSKGGFRRAAVPVDDVADEVRALAARRVRFRVIELRRWEQGQLISPPSSPRNSGRA